jgi:hypothetical protein
MVWWRSIWVFLEGFFGKKEKMRGKIFQGRVIGLKKGQTCPECLKSFF